MNRLAEIFRSLWDSTIGRFGLAAALVVLIGLAGYFATRHKTTVRPEAGNIQSQQQIGELFKYAVDTLQGIDDFGGGEAYVQSLNRLDQWLQTQKALDDWKVDPMAAPLLETFARIGEQVRPVAGALEAPRNRLELKAVGRQLAFVAEALEQIPQKLRQLNPPRTLEDIDALQAAHEEAIRAIEDATKRGGNPSQQESAEQALVDAFVKRQHNPARQACLKDMIALAHQLDEPAKIRDYGRLADLMQQLMRFAQTHDAEIQPTWDALQKLGQQMFRDKPSRLLIEVEFLLNQLRDPGGVGVLVEYRRVTERLAQMAQRLKTAADRMNRDDLEQLAVRFAEAGRKRDLQKLGELRRELETLAKPRELSDVKAEAAALADPAQRLETLAGEIAKLPLELENLRRLGEVCGAIGKMLREMAEVMDKFDSSQPQDKINAQLDYLTGRFHQIDWTIENLAADADRLGHPERLRFTQDDGPSLLEAIWLRDVSTWARGDDVDDLGRARRLFDWTVRNIVLEPKPKEGEPVLQTPRETLLRGRGQGRDRVRVFILLCRQQGIDAALLALPEAGKPSRPWAVGVIGEGKVYLFDPLLGVPIPAPGEIKRTANGELDLVPATLAQVSADDGLLRRMDVKDRPYPVTAEQAKKAIVLVEAAPEALSQRMRQLQVKLSGEQQAAFAAAPSAQAQRFKEAGLAEARLWSLPFEQVTQQWWLGQDRLNWQQSWQGPYALPAPVHGRQLPALAKGRVLHVKGKLIGDGAATDYYQAIRVPERELAMIRKQSPQLAAVLQLAKQDASFWLGLAAYEQENYPSATDYFATRLLEAYPDGPWSAASRYLLARCLEVQGKAAEAVDQYRRNGDQPDGQGNLLRGQWLEAAAGLKKPEKPETKPETKPEPKEKPAAKPDVKPEKKPVPEDAKK